jgi:hypothetical protein
MCVHAPERHYDRGNVCERDSVCVCVCVRERERERESERVSEPSSKATRYLAILFTFRGHDLCC